MSSARSNSTNTSSGNKRQKKNSASARNTLSSHFSPKQDGGSSKKYINTKIALTDEVYAPRDRDASVIGYVYIYRVKEVITTSREVKLKCQYLDQRIKVDDPLATIENHSDTNDLQAVEFQLIDSRTFDSAEARYAQHRLRMNTLAAQERQVEEDAAVLKVMSEEDEDEMWCADLKAFVAEHGAGGKDESGKTLLDLQFELLPLLPNDDGTENVNGLRKRRNVSDHAQTFNDYDTGGMLKKLRTIVSASKGKRNPNIVRAK